MRSGLMPASESARSTPICAQPRAEPAPRTNPILGRRAMELGWARARPGGFPSVAAALRSRARIDVDGRARKGTLASGSSAGPEPRHIRSKIAAIPCPRSEEHTSELQSLRHLVCRLLLEKKKKKKNMNHRY